MIHHDFTGQQTSFSKPVPKKQGDVPSLFSSASISLQYISGSYGTGGT
jgi:hypothetical protein